jgi:hypothetical protein
MLCNILVDRVVREAGQRVDRFVQMNFGFIRSGCFPEVQYGVDDVFQLGH